MIHIDHTHHRSGPWAATVRSLDCHCRSPAIRREGDSCLIPWSTVRCAFCLRNGLARQLVQCSLARARLIGAHNAQRSCRAPAVMTAQKTIDPMCFSVAFQTGGQTEDVAKTGAGSSRSGRVGCRGARGRSQRQGRRLSAVHLRRTVAAAVSSGTVWPPAASPIRHATSTQRATVLLVSED
jgi:hypothetical protein